jgi:hypothetical protein
LDTDPPITACFKYIVVLVVELAVAAVEVTVVPFFDALAALVETVVAVVIYPSPI